ncbi:sensor histidine kinase [Massilia glaciei]|nr:histidine kinase [Massilia glaciei]
MPFRFLPRDKLFWFYHAGALLFTGAVTLLTVLLWGKIVAHDIASTLVWGLPYTVAVLGFRWIYRRSAWRTLSMGKRIALAAAYGTVAALLIMLCVSAIVMPLFWNDIAAGHRAHGIAFEPAAYVTQAVVGGALQTQLFVCAWIFIYISFTGNRDVRAGELANLSLQGSLREARLSSLSNQLNPHFLFNSLNNIRFMVYENAQHADAMIVALADILRYSLESTEQLKLSVGREMEIVKRYLAIVNIQMEERLKVTLDVPEGVQALLMPPMVMQMLVENAIKHGIDQMQHGGTLAVTARLRDGQLRLHVANDVAPAAPGGRADTGIGLRNIEQRLQLLYGEQARLSVERQARRFEVLVTLPRELAA